MSTFFLDGKSITNTKGNSLFTLAETIQASIPSSCKQQGNCKECLLEITSGATLLSPLTKEEEHLTSRYRLACQTFIIGEGDVMAESLKRTLIRIEEKGIANLKDIVIDHHIYREGDNVISNDIVIAKTTGPLLGVAVDIGTTTVVIRLVDLETGKSLATASFENPQRFAGSNVMARIVYDTNHGKKELKRIFTTHLSNTILSISKSPQNIYHLVIAGNTTMRDIFFGLNVYTIGQSPYQSLTETAFREGKISTTALHDNARKMRLPICPKAEIYGLPLIGGHVGADTSAGLLAIAFMQEEKIIVYMDIGTNTEIVIGNNKRALAASSPSGPAFEGGGITFGMPALDGAIEKVRINDDDRLIIKTVGEVEPVGICGSGLLDILGELTRTEKINYVGRFEEEIDRFYLDKNKKVYIDEHDINLLAQTKAANIAALKILFKEYGIGFDEIDTFYLAGGFGLHVDIEAGIRIGLLPDIPLNKYKKIGNATIEGLVVALLSQQERDKLEGFVTHIEQLNLESDPDFFDYFVEGCLFHKVEQT